MHVKLLVPLIGILIASLYSWHFFNGMNLAVNAEDIDLALGHEPCRPFNCIQYSDMNITVANFRLSV